MSAESSEMIQVNKVYNAGASGVSFDEDGVRALSINLASWVRKATNIVQAVMITTKEKAKQLIDTNYYGVKNLTQVPIPLQQRFTSVVAGIVNVSSIRGAPNTLIHLGWTDIGGRHTLSRYMEELLLCRCKEGLEVTNFDVLEN
ncbi:hypothetical protein Tco_1261537 [Tanacetum coccineum]